MATTAAAPPPPATHQHLRWHPLRGEWVAYSPDRQHRTFLPPPDSNPLAPSADASRPTEVPAGRWDVAVFENRFPTFTNQAAGPPSLDVETRSGAGVCEVVVFTQDARASLGTLPLWHLELLIEVWADRYRALGSDPHVQYVYPFENRGVEVGVTLHHPHGQIYGYPFVPPIAARELAQQRQYLDRMGASLIGDMITAERREDLRVIDDEGTVVAFMPACARYSYEVWIAPVRPAASFADLEAGERRGLARALKTVLMKFDGLWQEPFPYVMAVHQAPTDGAPHPEAHLHLEFYPAYRMRGRLKYLAGSELGAGVFTADTLPEESVRDLQAVRVDIDA